MRWILAAAALVAGCSDEPVGGRGPFDPAEPQPQVVYGTPVIPPPGDPDPRVDPLVAEVDAALNGTPVVTQIGPDGRPVPYGAATAGAAVGAPDPGADIGIDPNDTSINLAATPLAEQVVQREEAARRREAAQQQLVIVEPEAVPEVNPDANVVAFARATNHDVGTRVYSRNALMSRSQSASACRGFPSGMAAQRQFLANGGPETDRFNLDPDGDGFACDFSPDPFRRLNF